MLYAILVVVIAILLRRRVSSHVRVSLKYNELNINQLRRLLK